MMQEDGEEGGNEGEEEERKTVINHYVLGAEHIIKSLGEPQSTFIQSITQIQGFIDKAKRTIDDYADRRDDSSTDDEKGANEGKSNNETPADFRSTPLSDINPNNSYSPPFNHSRVQNLETVGDIYALSEALEALQEIHKKKCSKPKPGTPETVIVQVKHAEQTRWPSYKHSSYSQKFGRPLTMRVRKDATIGEVKEMVRKRIIRNQCWRGGLSPEENNGRDDNGWSLEGGGWSKEVKVNVGDTLVEVEDEDIVGKYWGEDNDRTGNYGNNSWSSNNNYSNYSNYSMSHWNRSSRSNKPKGASPVKLKFLWTSGTKELLDTNKWDKDMGDAEEEEEETQSKGGVTLKECIKNFSTEEQLDENEEWYCSSCKVRMGGGGSHRLLSPALLRFTSLVVLTLFARHLPRTSQSHVRAYKKMTIWKPPTILIIQLKRFVYDGHFRVKIETEVDFPLEGLDLSEYVGACEGTDESYLYDCYAVSNHTGGLGGGHYTAHARKDNR